MSNKNCLPPIYISQDDILGKEFTKLKKELGLNNDDWKKIVKESLKIFFMLRNDPLFYMNYPAAIYPLIRPYIAISSDTLIKGITNQSLPQFSTMENTSNIEAISTKPQVTTEEKLQKNEPTPVQTVSKILSFPQPSFVGNNFKPSYTADDYVKIYNKILRAIKDHTVNPDKTIVGLPSNVTAEVLFEQDGLKENEINNIIDYIFSLKNAGIELHDITTENIIQSGSDKSDKHETFKEDSVEKDDDDIPEEVRQQLLNFSF